MATPVCGANQRFRQDASPLEGVRLRSCTFCPVLYALSQSAVHPYQATSLCLLTADLSLYLDRSFADTTVATYALTELNSSEDKECIYSNLKI